jgi:XTP/dITP diphosphohydrolase
MKNKEKTIYFVTGNKKKFAEVLQFFKDKHIEWILKHMDIKTFEIQTDSIMEVAKYKLKSVKEKINTSFFVEDAGFFVDIPLDGFPGVYSSYVLRTIGNEGILKLISDFSRSRAHFSAVIALYFKPNENTFYFEGVVKGRVSKAIRGTSGFGFDPIFIPDSIPNKTFAELSIEEKNRISHRGIALKKLINFLREC